MNISRVAIIGAGTMGKGIAQWFAQNGVVTMLCDVGLDFAQKSRDDIVASWNKLLEKKKFSQEQVQEFQQNLQVTGIEQISEVDLIIEAIIENESVKKELFSNLDKSQSEKTIFASNTSSLSIQSIASELSPARQAKFIGLHFFNPATLMKLVEIVETPKMTKGLSQELATWFDQRGKVSAICSDGPGFIVNRLARSYYGEALRIVQSEDEEREREVDSVLKEVGGFQMGPFELMDLIGIDINFEVTKIVWKAFKENPRFSPHPLQEKMVQEKRFGKKTKRGFYRYE